MCDATNKVPEEMQSDKDNGVKRCEERGTTREEKKKKKRYKEEPGDGKKANIHTEKRVAAEL